MPKYGWYSLQSAKLNGIQSYYETPAGDYVPVTLVNSDKNNSGSGWPDIFLIGEVTNWLGSSPPTHMKECPNFVIKKAFNSISGAGVSSISVSPPSNQPNPIGYPNDLDLMFHDVKIKTPEKAYSLGNFKELKRRSIYRGFYSSTTYLLLEDRSGFSKWVDEESIIKETKFHGNPVGVQNAFYDADPKFQPPEINEEEF